MPQTHSLIVGASLSGLACAACLQKQGIDYLILEKENQVAHSWRNHYQRLHLHTSKRFSHLPFRKFGKSIPRYPSREQVLDYIDDYQQAFNIQPRYHTEALSIKRLGEHWVAETSQGLFQSQYLIMATGAYAKPRPVDIRGLESFPGKILHSAQFKSGKDFQGQRVLVIGFGNSACEIAIDLCEQGAKPSLSVRSAVNVIPRDLLGIPILEWSLLLKALPPRVADALSAPLIRSSMGDLTKLGLKKRPYGPLEDIQREGRVPVLDIGTIRHIREGHIRLHGEMDYIQGKTIFFKDGKSEDFDALVAGIGYDRSIAAMLDLDRNRLEDLRRCIDKKQYFGLDGLYFCGFWISPTGQIREIALDAQKIARDIARKSSRRNS